MEITKHAISRYIERIDPRKGEHKTKSLLTGILLEEKRGTTKNRTYAIREMGGKVYTYYYIRAKSPFGITFYVAVDKDLTTAYTVITEDMFNNLTFRKESVYVRQQKKDCATDNRQY